MKSPEASLYGATTFSVRSAPVGDQNKVRFDQVAVIGTIHASAGSLLSKRYVSTNKLSDHEAYLSTSADSSAI